MSGYEAMIEEVRFAEDSPLEGDGFELWVPATGTMVFVRALGPGSFANKTDGPKCLSLRTGSTLPARPKDFTRQTVGAMAKHGGA